MTQHFMGTNRPGHLAEDHTILPAQFFARATWTPEQKLLAAILEDALFVLMKYKGNPHARARRLFDEEIEWVESEEVTYLFSFASVCAALKLDEAWMRAGIRRWVAGLPTSITQRDHMGMHPCSDEGALHLQRRRARAQGRRYTVCRQQHWVQQQAVYRVWIEDVETGLSYDLGRFSSKTQAASVQAKARNHPKRTLAQVLARREAEMAA